MNGNFTLTERLSEQQVYYDGGAGQTEGDNENNWISGSNWWDKGELTIVWIAVPIPPYIALSSERAPGVFPPLMKTTVKVSRRSVIFCSYSI